MQTGDFRQRKLVIDTFGWLPFKQWFQVSTIMFVLLIYILRQDRTFRSWWNCSGFTSVPLYSILQRNPSHSLNIF